jgi:hypothetical protein
MSDCNDLIGLPYGFGCRPGDGTGMTDCFQLVCEVRRRLGLRDYAPEFDWVYRSYSEETFSRIRLIRWLMERCNRTTEPVPGDVVLFGGATAMGVVTAERGAIFLAGGKRVARLPSVPSTVNLFRPRP